MARLAVLAQAGEGAIRARLIPLAGGRPEGPADPSSDADYARALALGDPQAARRFMDRNLPTILGIARRLLRDAAEAEDAAQDVFVKVWRNAHGWQPGKARFDSWVGRIAINACYDRLRRRREVPAETMAERADGVAGAEDRLGAEAGAGRVREAIAALPERQRLALELCHFQEHTNIEAAEMMETSVEAVESLLARARRTLRAALAGQAGELIADLAAGRGEEA